MNESPEGTPDVKEERKPDVKEVAPQSPADAAPPRAGEEDAPGVHEASAPEVKEAAPPAARDEDTQDVNELDRKYAEAAPSDEFAALLKETASGEKHKEVKVGQQVSGKIRKIDTSAAFIDYGGRSEAVIDLVELRNEAGELGYAEGDTIEAYVSATEGEVRLTKSMKTTSRTVVREAFESGMPIDGRVTGFNKGGLVVSVGGMRAFCPLSQIEMGFCQEPESYAGKTLAFKIIELRGGGRNIVVSHRALLEEEARQRARELRDKLKVGEEIDGKVMRIERFGAFVDIGGVEGLLHVSEISHTRVGNPQDVLNPGDAVRVKILEMKDLGGDKERLSLSMKALLPDPWDDFRKNHNEGEVIEGKVVSIQNFGAFVQILPGVEGLVHISQLSDKRIGNPSEVVTIGQEVKARIQSIDTKQHRISLSMRDAEAAETAAAESREIAEFRAREQGQSGEADNAMAEALRRAGLV